MVAEILVEIAAYSIPTFRDRLLIQNLEAVIFWIFFFLIQSEFFDYGQIVERKQACVFGFGKVHVLVVFP